MALRSPIAGFLALSTACGGPFFLMKVAPLTALTFFSACPVLGFFLGGRMLRDGLVVNVAVDAG